MFLIKTETRELKIDNGNGEKYFDAVLRMMLDEKTTNMGFSVGMEPGATVKVPLVSTLNPEKTEENEGGYRGFLHLECSRCGRTRTFYAKDKITTHRCCDCGKETELTEMRKAYTSCGCGQDSFYLTNSTRSVLRIPCVKCGVEVHVGWDSEKKCYETIGE